MKHLIVFYDGPCVLCNRLVHKLCEWDTKDQIRFSSLDSPLFNQFALKRELVTEDIDSIVVWDQQFLYSFESQAVFRIIKQLGGLWRLLLIISLLPSSWTDALYRFVARNRYRWFGTHDICPLPDPQYAHKFIA